MRVGGRYGRSCRCSRTRARQTNVALTLPHSHTLTLSQFRTLTLSQVREKLPVFAEEQVIMEAVKEHDVFVLCGATGRSVQERERDLRSW